jgi:hypothetical protein
MGLKHRRRALWMPCSSCARKSAGEAGIVAASRSVAPSCAHGWHAKLSGAELLAVYRRADLWGLPLLDFVGNSVLVDAMGLGLPVAAARRAIPEAVGDEAERDFSWCAVQPRRSGHGRLWTGWSPGDSPASLAVSLGIG